MVEYAPIDDLVKKIPADIWDVLQEIKNRRGGIMLSELLKERQGSPRRPECWEPRSLKNHPANPRAA
jgi:hypothetical protein